MQRRDHQNLVPFDPEIDRTYHTAARARRQSLLEAEENLNNIQAICSDIMEDQREYNQNRRNNENQINNGNGIGEQTEVNQGRRL